MFFHPIKKSIGLIILYSAIIIGIFVLQFRNESVITKSFGALKIALAQTQDREGVTSLKNSLQVSFGGISFTADEVTPAILSTKDEAGNIDQKKLTLLSYEQQSPLSVIFNFDNDVSLTFTTTDESKNANLSIQSNLPDNADSVVMNFKPTSGYSVTEKTNARQIFSSKDNMYALAAAKLSDEEMTLTSKNPFVNFAQYDPSTIFTFASIDSQSTIALQSTYETCMKTLKNHLLTSAVELMNTPSQLSENIVIAYVAEMAAQGKYQEAIEKVPESFKKGSKRSYLSAPYFGNLEAMQPSMAMKNKNMTEMIENASDLTTLTSNSLNIFTVEDLAEFINLFGATDSVKRLLSIPSAIFSTESANQDFKLTISQATGILRTYLELSSYNSSLADYLAPTIENCLKTIEENCSMTESSVIISENENPVSVITALETGAALIRYGKMISSQEHITAGYAITNTVLTQNSPDLMTVAELYPIIVENKNYPHYIMLYRDKNIWAWTCLKSLTYTEKNNVGNLVFKSNIGDIHHILLTNVPKFKDINIYGLSYHSDPRFESYASSGYVYKESIKTLLLKSRHKSETETIKLTF